MPLMLLPAIASDAPRIAEIHMLAFCSNSLLRAQFPSPSTRLALQNTISQKALADIQDPWVSVMVVRDTDSQSLDSSKEGKVISFSKWHQPVPDHLNYEERPWIWPAGTDHEVLDRWTRITDAVFEKLFHQSPCFRLSFLGTDPDYERRGAASLMLEWGMDQCRMKKTPVYLESTTGAGQLYRKHGFVAEERVEMDLNLVEDGRGVERYSEECFVYRP